MGLVYDELIAGLKDAPVEFLDPAVAALRERFGQPAVALSVAKQVRADADTHETVCMADVKTEYVDWLWYGYIPYGSLSIVLGDPGIGKGTFTIDLASRLSRGRPMPQTDIDIKPAGTLLLTIAEDDLAATIKPRLEAAGADCHRIFAFTDLLSVPDDVAYLAAKIEEHKARLVLIDPLNAYLNQKVDGHKDQDVRRAFAPLKLLAEKTGAAVVMVHHMNKSSGQSAIYRGGGSIGITGAARCVLLVERHPNDPEQRVLARVKGNLSAEPESLAFRLANNVEHRVPVMDWIGAVPFTADQLLSPPKDEERAAAKLTEAMDFFRSLLGEGQEVLSSEIGGMLKDAGIAFKTAERARKELGVKSRRQEGKGRQWHVYLPSASDNIAIDGELEFDREHGEVGEVTEPDTDDLDWE